MKEWKTKVGTKNNNKYKAVTHMAAINPTVTTIPLNINTHIH